MYKDQTGDPLHRRTLDWRENDRKMIEYMTAKGVEMARALGVKEFSAYPGYSDYDVTRYQSTPVKGGTFMAPTPDRGVVNPYLQHWQLPNLFVLGASF